MQNAIGKFSPTMPTLVEEFSSFCDYFVGLPGFPDLIEKVFLINWCREKFTVFTEKGMREGEGGGGEGRERAYLREALISKYFQLVSLINQEEQ